MKKVNCILLVDDSHPDNYFHKRIIEGVNVAEVIRLVTNGKDALDYLLNTNKFEDKAKNPTPQIIFLDINMPGMSGFEFLVEYEKFTDNLKAEHCIVILTTSVNAQDQKKAEDFNSVSGFLIKPLKENDMINILERF